MQTLTQPDLIRFPVHDVEPMRELLDSHELDDVLARALGCFGGQSATSPSLVAAGGVSSTVLSLGPNPLLGATHAAFARHLPLRLTPDAIWLTIQSGFANHVRLYAEELRDSLVNHAGREEIYWETQDLPGSPALPWEEVVDRFVGELEPRIGHLGQLLIADFSTTGPVERTASQILCMDVFEPYFRYVLGCVCGIPEVILTGTVADWEQLALKAHRLASFHEDRWGLCWWFDQLQPLLEELASTARGQIDREHWRRAYKETTVYAAEMITGWMGKLVPYVQGHPGELVPNPLLLGDPDGCKSSLLPVTMSNVPMCLRFPNGKEMPLRLAGGLGAVHQDPQSFAVTPVAAWAVVAPGEQEQVLTALSQFAAAPGRGDRQVQERFHSELRVHATTELTCFLNRFDGMRLPAGGRLYGLREVSLLDPRQGTPLVFGELVDGMHLLIDWRGRVFVRTRELCDVENREDAIQGAELLAESLTEFLRGQLDG